MGQAKDKGTFGERKLAAIALQTARTMDALKTRNPRPLYPLMLFGCDFAYCDLLPSYIAKEAARRDVIRQALNRNFNIIKKIKHQG